MDIIFKDITYQNIMSVGAKPVHIDLNEHKKTLVTGINGAGKSTFIEALTFLLYGKPFRNIKKGQLVNSVNGKGLLVQGNISVGKNEFFIKRGIKPNILEIHKNGEKLPELASVSAFQEYFETELLGVSFESFKQIIVLGTAGYKPFMELSAGERRSLVEDLLDLSVLSQMDKVNKSELKLANQSKDLVEVKEESNKKSQDVARRSLENEKAATQQHIDDLVSSIKRCAAAAAATKATIEEKTNQLNSLSAPPDEFYQKMIDDIRSKYDRRILHERIEETKSGLMSPSLLEQAIKELRESTEEKRDKLERDLRMVTEPIFDVSDLHEPEAPEYYGHEDAEIFEPDFDEPDFSQEQARLAEIQRQSNELIVKQKLTKAHIDFHTKGGECPNCGTESTGDETKVESLQSALANIELELSELKTEKSAIDSRMADFTAEYSARLKEHRDWVAGVEKEIADYEKAKHAYDLAYTDRLNKYNDSVDKAERDRAAIQASIAHLDVELADGIEKQNHIFETNNLTIALQIKDIEAGLTFIEGKIADEIAAVEATKLADRVAVENQAAVLTASIEAMNASLEEARSEALMKKEKVESLREMVYDTSVLDELVVELNKLGEEKMELIEEINARTTIVSMLKDSGIKSHILKQYIPLFNKKINGYLKTMGADYVFTLDNEFNEVIKSRGREEFSYTSFSQGERARINIALLFTWRDIAGIVSGTNINLLILDEVFDGAVDSEGVKAFNDIMASTEANIFVISHRVENMDTSFNQHIKMIKRGRFTVRSEG